MSAALRGLNQGLQTGLQLGSVLRDARMRRALQEEAAKYGVTEDAGVSQEQIGRAQAETAGLAAQDAAEFGLEAPQQFRVEEAQPVAPSFRVGDQAFKTREEATRGARPLRAEGLARVYEQYGDIERAEELRERADAGRLREMQMEATGLDLQTRRRDVARTQEFDTGMAAINKQTFEAPEQRTAAILDLVEATQGPQARAALEASYTSNQLNSISLDSAKFQQGFQQAFTKGLDATMKWLDSQNPGFTLERRGNQVIRVDEDGSRSVFASGSDFEIMEQFAGMATPSNFLTLAQNRVNRDIARDRMKQERSQLIQVEDSDGKLRLIDTTRLPRDESGQPILPEGLRKTGTKEASPMTTQEKQAFDVLKGTDRFKRAVETGDEKTIRELLAANNIRPEAYLGARAAPPGGGDWSATPPSAAAAQPTRTAGAAAEPALTRQPSAQSPEQVRLYNRAIAAGYKVVGTSGARDLIVEAPNGTRTFASRLP
jgi:hypothetical protein